MLHNVHFEVCFNSLNTMIIQNQVLKSWKLYRGIQQDFCCLKLWLLKLVLSMCLINGCNYPAAILLCLSSHHKNVTLSTTHTDNYVLRYWHSYIFLWMNCSITDVVSFTWIMVSTDDLCQCVLHVCHTYSELFS